MKKTIIIITLILAIILLSYLTYQNISNKHGYDDFMLVSLSGLNGIDTSAPMDIGLALNQMGRVRSVVDIYRLNAIRANGDYYLYNFLLMCYQEYQDQLTIYLNENGINNETLSAYRHDFQVVYETLVKDPQMSYEKFTYQAKDKFIEFSKFIDVMN